MNEPRISRQSSGAFVTIDEQVFHPRSLFGFEAATAIADKLRERNPESRVHVWRVYGYAVPR